MEHEKNDELEARWLTRDEMTELMSKIRAHVAEAEAERASATPRPLSRGTVFPVEEEERREELRRQADALLAKEGDEAK